MIFDIPDEIMQDKDIIKVIDGIAGAAKSSKIDAYFCGNYNRYTSTVKLMKDAKKRYNCECDTIAGGLFTAEDGRFFVEEKTPECEIIVIDEILQTDSRVLRWAEKYKGLYNIIITTDSHQMLPKGQGKLLLQAFKEFCKEDFVHYTRLTKSLRPRDKKTEELYKDLFEHVESDVSMWEKYKKVFKTISYKDMPFNNKNVYLPHTNDIEEFVYVEKDVPHADLDFIPKGCIAKRNVDFSRYPVACQNKALKFRLTNYLQAANIATVTRYQGSEVEEGQKCYFLIEKNSNIGNRELYTALTRCWYMDDFIIVICDTPKSKKRKSFRGFPVKDIKTLSLTSEEIDASWIHDGIIDKKAFEEKRHISPDYYFKTDSMYIDGVKYTTEKEEVLENKYTISGLLKKYPELDYGFMENMYDIVEERTMASELSAPYVSKIGDRDKQSFEYYLDLFSAYPHVLSYGNIPVDCEIEPWTFDDVVYDGEAHIEDGWMYIGYYEGPCFSECLMTLDMFIILNNTFLGDERFDTDVKFTSLFRVKYIKGCDFGREVLEKALKSVEDKAETKTLKWGYLNKNYIMDHTKTFEDDHCFVRNILNNRVVLYTAIKSELFTIMFQLSKFLNGQIERIQEDAVYFDGEDKVQKAIDWMQQHYPEYRYRIKKRVKYDKFKPEYETVYQTFEDLKTKADIKKEQARERQRRRREKIKNM